MYKRINKPLLKNDKALYEIGDISNEIIGDPVNWENVNKTIWDLKEEDIYYSTDDDGTISEFVWYDDKYDNRRLSIGNVYLTRENAEEASWRSWFETKMRKEFKPEECDWGNYSVYKNCIVFKRSLNKIIVQSLSSSQIQGVIYCNDEETVEQFIKDNEQDLLRYFGVVRR